MRPGYYSYKQMPATQEEAIVHRKGVIADRLGMIKDLRAEMVAIRKMPLPQTLGMARG